MPTVDYHFPHFRDRLKERYNLDISLEEYLALNEEPVLPIYYISCQNKIGTVSFKGVELVVIKYMNPKVLKTVLLKDREYPMPKIIKEAGFTKEQFHAGLKAVIKEIEDVKEIFLTKTAKEIYMTRPGDYPIWLYGNAHFLAKGKPIDLNVLIGKRLNYILLKIQDASTVETSLASAPSQQAAEHMA